jgi:hypothetical protein
MLRGRYSTFARCSTTTKMVMVEDAMRRAGDGTGKSYMMHAVMLAILTLPVLQPRKRSLKLSFEFTSLKRNPKPTGSALGCLQKSSALLKKLCAPKHGSSVHRKHLDQDPRRQVPSLAADPQQPQQGEEQADRLHLLEMHHCRGNPVLCQLGMPHR